MRENAYHGQQPPHHIRRLRADSYPVLRPQRVQLDVLVQLARAVVRVLLGYGVVGTDHLERSAVTRCPVGLA